MNAKTSINHAMKQAVWEFKLNARNGEQLLLLVIIPVIVYFALTRTSFIGGASWDAQNALSVAVTIATLAAGFTSLAIATAFERRSGTLLYMGTTPVTRLELVLGKSLSTFLLALVSSFALCVVALITGWQPTGKALLLIGVLLVGTLSVSGYAFLMAGTMRAEAVLALANGIFVVVLMFGGVIFQYNGIGATIASLFPPRALLILNEWAVRGANPSETSVWISAIVLISWGVLGILLASKFFKWR
ncbi:MAG: ABC transporter permease [Candidatus Nanopelagicales bacterium]|jgi:ABC-2 type transport system permease protein